MWLSMYRVTICNENQLRYYSEKYLGVREFLHSEKYLCVSEFLHSYIQELIKNFYTKKKGIIVAFKS